MSTGMHRTDTYHVFTTELITHTTNGMVIKNCVCKLANVACLITVLALSEQMRPIVIPHTRLPRLFFTTIPRHVPHC